MIIIPAIDLIDGRCVRLTEGAFNTAKIYDNNPAAMAGRFAEAGAQRLHVVDLDAARGNGNNRGIIRQIRAAFPGTLDVGGGIRSLDDVKHLQDAGADLMVVGTALVKSPDTVARWAAEVGEILIAGIDARDGEVRIAAWESGSSLQAHQLAQKARDVGMVEIIHTDIARDGRLEGPNIEGSAAMARISGLPVIVSGGVGSMDDLRQLRSSPPEGIRGVIVGKAIYEKRVDLKAAFREEGI